ncbi:MAG: restriction endonuclease subunit S [Ilumatobacter sp.]|nr:restriction endonuclease subunit S [Ilumatobacter sp.]
MKALSWPIVSLGDVCELRYGKALPAPSRTGSGFRVFGSNGEVGRHRESITAGATVIVGRKGSFGEVHFSEDPCWPIDTTYYVDAHATTADLRWLFHRMKAMPLTQLNRAAAVPGLNRDDAYKQTLLLPSIEEQRRIAAVLDAADALRAKRRQALAKVDTLTQAIFIDMFGDTVTNSKGWPDVATLGEVSDVRSGITKGRKVSEEVSISVPYLAVSNVQDGHVKTDTLKSIGATSDEIERYALRAGDILLTEGGDPDKLGRGAVWDGRVAPCIHQNHIFRVRVAVPHMTAEFLSALLSSARGKSYFLRMAKQTTGIASINMAQLRSFPILEPPLALQREYIERMVRLQAQKAAASASLDGHDALFASLQQRAFRGEL